MSKLAGYPSSGPLGVACALAMVAAGVPAFSQEPAGEFTITAQGGGPHERSLTASVYYRDLDLTTKGGRAVLRQRVRSTASELCHRLGDDNRSAAVAFVCEDEAVESAANFERAVIAQAMPRAYVSTSPAKAAPGR
jgi:UrcA family protein